jgi:AbrB family looped-hinge helix DNA binding protein
LNRKESLSKKGGAAMQSTITSKYQTTIPKTIRENLSLDVNDTLEWEIDQGKIIVFPKQKRFLEYQNRIRVGKGDISADIALARDLRLKDQT